MYTDTRRTEQKSEAELEFSHFVVVSSEGSIIAFARNNGSVYKFLMETDTGWVKIQSIDQWLELTKEMAEQVRQRAQESFGRVPVYRIPRLIL